MENLYKKIAETLKELRKKREWSLDKAAQATGVSKAMLGQIERGESSPTIATLWKIASGFDTSFSSFIATIQSDFTEPVYRSGQTPIIHPKDENIRVLPLFPFDEQLHFEVYMIELLPGCEQLSPPHQYDVIEHVIVIEGAMEVLINGIWQQLENGEGIRFPANQPHGYRNKSSHIARFHNIVHYRYIPSPAADKG